MTSKVTLPRELFKAKNVNKDNKTKWEDSSRKLRAILPIFTKINNTKTRKELRRRESRKSIKSIFSRSSRK